MAEPADAVAESGRTVIEPMDACAVLSAAVDEPLAGTAPKARGWLVLEHPGPYERDALAGLPDPLATGLAEIKSRLGLGVLLARAADREHRGAAAPRVWLAAAGAGHYEQVELRDPDDLLTWQLDPLAEGRLPRLGEPRTEPLLLVCANGRRDLCCGRRGRAVLAATDDPAVLACSHLGGHRLAATALLLPGCYALGRLAPGGAQRVLAAARTGQLPLELVRGRCGRSAAAQIAELAVRAVTGDRAMLPGPHVADDAAAPLVPVVDSQGVAWEVLLTHAEAVSAPESCGAASVERAPLRVAHLRRCDAAT